MNARQNDIIFRPVEARDYPDLRALYNRVWNRTRDERYDMMRFRDTLKGLPIAAVGEEQGEVAGFFTLWPLDLTDGKTIIPAGEAMDVMTDDRFRGRGVFPKLAAASAKFAADRGIQILFGAPNAAIFNGYLKKLAWAAPGFIRSFTRPLSLKGVVPAGGITDPVFALGSKKDARGFNIVRSRPDDAALEDCLSRSEGKGRNSAGGGQLRVHRTPAWYDFRYQDAGRFDYSWIALWQGNRLAGFTIWALSLEPGQRLRRANLVEIIGEDDGVIHAAIKIAIADAQMAGANFLHAVMTAPHRAPMFRKLGFLPLKKTPLIARTLDAASHGGNPFLEDGWDLFGGDFDFT